MYKAIEILEKAEREALKKINGRKYSSLSECGDFEKTKKHCEAAIILLENHQRQKAAENLLH